MENSLNSALLEAYSTLEKFEGKFDAIDKKILAVSQNARSIKPIDPETISPKGLNEKLKQNAEFNKQINASLKEQEKLEKALISQIAKKQAALSNTNKELQRHRLETQIINREAKQEAVLTSKLTSEYQKLNVRLQQMIGVYKDLAAKKVQGIKLTKQEESQYKRLESQIRKTDTAIKGIDRSVGQNFRNVGNYGSALKGLGGSLRSLASAFGFTSGVFLFAGAVKDAFSRVREFDKSMQNLAGVMRTTRDDLGDLEQTIISVAGSSVRTSNEVAKLAEALATMGKSKNEIKDLLKPVIDLSLGLDAPADEAGEFLVQMLNSFGKSTDSAAEFADTIATIRTSTTLDFQKMRDSFAYIAPIANLLNKDLAWTGATVGILADNGLKAESSGRLLSTALIKLATAGKTLPQALEEINELFKNGASELEILTKANDLFGKQSAKIGAILAINTNAIEENAQAVRDNGGALKDLTDRQLESLDAKLKILDATYESFLLNLDNGNSVIGSLTKNGIEKLTTSIKTLEIFSNNTSTALKAVFGIMTANVPLVKEASDEITHLGQSYSKATKAITEQNQAFIDQYGSLAPLTKQQQQLIDNQEKINKLFGGGQYFKTDPYDDGIKTIGELKQEIRDLQDELDELEETDEDGIEVLQRKIRLKQQELDLLLGTNKSKKEENDILKGSIAFHEKEISSLEDKRNKQARNSEEWKKLTKRIEEAKWALAEYKRVLGIDMIPSGEIDTTRPPLDDWNPNDAEEEDLFAKEAADLDARIELHKEFLKKKKEVEEHYANESQQLQEQIYSNISQFVDATLQSIIESQSNKYDEQIDANNDFYDKLLENEELTEKQRQALEEERNIKNAELEKKKQETERKGFLFKQLATLAEIAIDTVQKVAALKAEAAVLAGNPLTAPLASIPLGLIPDVITSGSIAGATVLATSIPQFKEGHLEGNYEGLAIVNDAPSSNYREIIERRNGMIEMFDGRNQVIEMEKGDRVHKAGTFDPSKLLQNGLALSVLDNENKIAIAQMQMLNQNKIISKEIGRYFEKAIKKMPQTNFIAPTAKEIGKEAAKAMYLEIQANKA